MRQLIEKARKYAEVLKNFQEVSQFWILNKDLYFFVLGHS